MLMPGADHHQKIRELVGEDVPEDRLGLLAAALKYIEERHWDPEAEEYYDYDLVAGDRIRVPCPAGLAAPSSRSGSTAACRPTR